MPAVEPGRSGAVVNGRVNPGAIGIAEIPPGAAIFYREGAAAARKADRHGFLWL